MKHIKSIKEKYGTEDYYKEVNEDEWFAFKPLMISDKNINKIEGFARGRFIFEISGLNRSGDYGNIYKYISLRKWSYLLQIYESEDDYFYVYREVENGRNVKHNRYKCDQIDGLEKLINDCIQKL